MPVVAQDPHMFTIPKPGGGVRLMTRLGPDDAAGWRRLAAESAPRIEAALDPRVLGNRWRSGPERLARFEPALARARTAARLVSGTSEVTVRTDVRSFYASVDAAVLDRALARMYVDRAARSRCGRLVEGWSDAGVPGLPVGPEPSALFANAVLASADRALQAAGIRFLRWVDDYLIDPGARDPALALAVLDAALDELGLSRHAEKTVLDEGSTPWPGGTYRGAAAGTIDG